MRCNRQVESFEALTPYRAYARARQHFNELGSIPSNGSSLEPWRNAGAQAQRICETPIFPAVLIFVPFDLWREANDGRIAGSRSARSRRSRELNSNNFTFSETRCESFQRLRPLSEFAAKFPRGESPSVASVNNGGSL